MRFLAHGAGRAEHAQPHEHELRHVDRPGERHGEEAHDRRHEDEAGYRGKQENADRKLDLTESLQHEQTSPVPEGMERWAHPCPMDATAYGALAIACNSSRSAPYPSVS